MSGLAGRGAFGQGRPEDLFAGRRRAFGGLDWNAQAWPQALLFRQAAVCGKLQLKMQSLHGDIFIGRYPRWAMLSLAPD
jgi:hypothetical protein